MMAGVISVESTAEWKIHDILFDGQERYLQPPQFADHVAKLAHKIEWRELIGCETTRDDPSVTQQISQEEQSSSEGQNNVKGQSSPATSANKNVGPWDFVATKLFKGLTEMNVLLDLVGVAAGGEYLTLDPQINCPNPDLQDPPGSDAPNHMQVINHSDSWRTVTYFAKKKALLQASVMINDELNRAKNSSTTDFDVDQANDQYQTELISFRRHCRLKKVGKTMLGDIACNTFGPKFQPHSTLQVRRCANKNENGGSTLQLELPSNLKVNNLLKVVLYNPGEPTKTYIPSSEKCFENHAREFPWEITLKSAQQTLLSKELFQILARDSVNLKKYTALVNKQEICLKLKFGYYLKILLVENENDVVLEGESIETIEQELWNDYFDRLGKADYCCQPISGGLPVISAANSHFKLDGYNSKNSKLMKGVDRKFGLMDELIKHATHVLLQNKLTHVFSLIDNSFNDPVIYWHWSLCSKEFSILKASIYTPPFETNLRQSSSFTVELKNNRVFLTTKDGERIEISADIENMMYMIKVQAHQHQLNSIAHLCRCSSWQILSCNPHSLDSKGRIAPILLVACNSGVRSFLVRLLVDEPPEIYIQTEEFKGFDSQIMDLSSWNPSGFRGKLKLVEFEKLSGTTLIHKIELILVAVQIAC